MNYKVMKLLFSFWNVNPHRLACPRNFRSEQLFGIIKKSSVESCSKIYRFTHALSHGKLEKVFSLFKVISANVTRLGLNSVQQKFGERSSNLKYIMLGAMGSYMHASNSEGISLSIIEQFLNEVELLEALHSDTGLCHKCKKKHKETCNELDKCSCFKDFAKIFCEQDCWDPYLSRDNIIIWRKEEKPALYSYKVYAKYDDITPNDFLHVQTDLEYRKQWDATVAALDLIEIDLFNDRHVIYWETKWPRMFANRDYVYSRKIYTDKNKKWIVICNKSSSHSKCPVYMDKHRVEDYWSYMIIKPFTTFYEPGLQYVLIYFDDPGLAIPSTVTSWIAQTQMPEFLYKLYIATKKYANQSLIN